MLTPECLVSELEDRGYPCSKRQILDWISKGLLPELSERGKGQGLGKTYFWNNSTVIEQAVTVHILRSLKYPTTIVRTSIWLMGFPCDPENVRLGWLSRIEKLQVQQTNEARKAEELRGSPFSDFEDKASALSIPIAKHLSKTFRLNQAAMTLASLETYNFIFGDMLAFDTESLEHLMTVIAGATGFDAPNFSDRELGSILEFLRSLGWNSAFSLAKRSTGDELEMARAQWLQLVALMKTAFPALNGSLHGLRVVDFLSVKFPGECLLPFLAFINRGKRREVSITLENASHFVRTHAIPQSIQEAIMVVRFNHDFRSDLIALLDDLSLLWRHEGYPFLPDNGLQK
jgi:hypothetical protein